MKLVIVSATRGTKTEFAKMPLGQTLSAHPKICDRALITYKNREGLGVVYNRALSKFSGESDVVVLCVHDDVSIQDGDLRSKLEEATEQFDIVGLAGIRKVEDLAPAAWHAMGDHSGPAPSLIPEITSSGLVPLVLCRHRSFSSTVCLWLSIWRF